MKKAYNVDVLQYGIDENSGLFIVKKFSPPLNDQGYYIACIARFPPNPVFA